MLRYSSYEDFSGRNGKNLELVLKSKTKLMSLSDLSITGHSISRAEELAYEFLNLSNVITDLMFGLSASVLDAKTKVKEVEGTIFRDLGKMSAADKTKLIQADKIYVASNQIYNDLIDLQEYLVNKKKDAETSYYYYRAISSNK